MQRMEEAGSDVVYIHILLSSDAIATTHRYLDDDSTIV
jgi:hypothetical protein